MGGSKNLGKRYTKEYGKMYQENKEQIKGKGIKVANAKVYFIKSEYLFLGSILEIMIEVPFLSSGCESNHFFNPP